MNWSRSAVLAALVLFGSTVAANAGYDDTKNDAQKILNASLGSVGKCVVVTVSSTGAKDQEYYAKLPNDKYSSKEDNSPLSIIEVTKRINEAIDKAKAKKQDTTITIRVQIKMPSK